MEENGTLKRFITIPPITKDVWDHLQSFVPKTLAVSFMGCKEKKDEVVSVTAPGARAAWPSWDGESLKRSACVLNM